MSANQGPYPVTLPTTARRLGRGGRAFMAGDPGAAASGLGLVAGDFLGNVTAVTWSVSAEQIAVPIPGQWKTFSVAGAETRSFTMRYQDVDDRWRMFLYKFFEARKADLPFQPPKFDILTKLTGGPVVSDGSGGLKSVDSDWVIQGCRIYGFDGGFSSTEDVLERELSGTFESEEPANAFQYTSGESGGQQNFTVL